MDPLPNIQYIRAGIEDVKEVIDMRIAFLIDLFGRESDEAIAAFRANTEAFLREALPSQLYICWLAKDGDTVVAAGGLTVRQHPGNFKNPSGRVGYIMSMYTVPAYRKMGICSAILNHLVTTGKEIGLNSFELHATKEGEPVYIKNGFKVHPDPTYRKIIETN